MTKFLNQAAVLLADRLHVEGYRASIMSGESTEYYKLFAPDGRIFDYQNRFDEPSGVDNTVLGFKLRSGQNIQLNFDVSKDLLDALIALD